MKILKEIPAHSVRIIAHLVATLLIVLAAALLLY